MKTLGSSFLDQVELWREKDVCWFSMGKAVTGLSQSQVRLQLLFTGAPRLVTL